LCPTQYVGVITLILKPGKDDSLMVANFRPIIGYYFIKLRLQISFKGD